jgi:hypothetical protein
MKGWDNCRELLEKRAVDPSEIPSYNPSGNPSIKGSDTECEKGSANTTDTPYSLLPTPYSPTPDSQRDAATNYTDEFERVYSLYPLKASKAAAFKSFQKAKKQVSVETITEGVVSYRDDPNRDPQFTKHFSTWLNQGCWDDDPLPPRSGQKNASDERMERNLQVVRDLMPTDGMFQLGGQ